MNNEDLEAYRKKLTLQVNFIIEIAKRPNKSINIKKHHILKAQETLNNQITEIIDAWFIEKK